MNGVPVQSFVAMASSLRTKSVMMTIETMETDVLQSVPSSLVGLAKTNPVIAKVLAPIPCFFFWLIQSYAVVDIDECAEDVNLCPTSSCINTISSYACVPYFSDVTGDLIELAGNDVFAFTIEGTCEHFSTERKTPFV